MKCRIALAALLITACATGVGPSTETSALSFREVEGGLRAHIAERGLVATLRGTTIEVRSERASARFETTGLGCGLDVAIDGTRAEGERVELARGGVTEWYVSRSEGLEQGFTIAERPSCGGEPLAIDVRVSGALHATLESDTRVVLSDAGGVAQLEYGGLSVRDANGALVPSRLALTGDGIRIVVEERAAAYPIVIDPLVTNPSARLNASDGVADDQLGYAVAVSGDTLVVGAPQVGASDAGAAYVFVRNAGTWTQQARLAVTGTDHFGYAVAISNDTIVIGAPYGRSFAGDAYVFVRSGTTWTQQGGSLNGGVVSTVFGNGVGISGDIAVIGAPGRFGDQGQAYVYTRVAGIWTQTDTLNPQTNPGPGMKFGTSVAFDGANMIIGAPFTNVGGVIRGSAYAFGITCFGNWGEEAQLVGTGTTTNSAFGSVVSVSGGTAMVGAPNHTFVTSRGIVYFYTRMDPGGLCPTIVWTEQQSIVSSDVADNDHFGEGVSIVGDRAVVGAYGAAIGGVVNAGAGYYFTRTAGVWSERSKLVATDTGILADGASAALGADYAALGATVAPSGTATRTGAVYVFDVSHGPNGATCTLGTDCASGFCADGFCCNVACGGSVTADCQACSVAAGGLVDGTCHSVAVGRTCDDASLCTTGDACTAGGTCSGTTSCAPIDACHTAACAPATGVCTQSARPDGAACDDADGCTTGDTCQAGACTPGAARVCTALDTCHVAGTCSSATGTCTNPSAANGTACNDGSACTTLDTCQTGVCTGASPVTCTALDACHGVGTCDPTTGTCSSPMLANGTSCDDGVACTSGDVCTAGACAGAAIVCTAGPCQTAGTCSAGTCSAPTSLADGTACPMGMCMTGACVFPDGGAMPDAGNDAGMDAGSVGTDAGAGTDAGGTTTDAGAAIDAGDAGDAGPDAGARDGSVRDGALGIDVGTISPPTTNAGCGCSVPSRGGSRGGAWLLIGLALVIVSRRRR